MQRKNKGTLRRHPLLGYKLSNEGGRLPTRIWLNNRIRNLQEKIAKCEKQLLEHLMLAEPIPEEVKRRQADERANEKSE